MDRRGFFQALAGALASAINPEDSWDIVESSRLATLETKPPSAIYDYERARDEFIQCVLVPWIISLELDLNA